MLLPLEKGGDIFLHHSINRLMVRTISSKPQNKETTLFGRKSDSFHFLRFLEKV